MSDRLFHNAPRAAAWSRRVATLVGLGAGLNGCDAAAPGPPASADADLAAIGTALSNFELAIATPAMHSLGIVGARMTVPGVATPAAAPPFACAPHRAASPQPHPAARGPRRITGLIADTLFGRIYAYDAPSRSYVLGATAGGPANGVRFLLDALDAYGQPTNPPAQVGWLDLTDESAGSAVQLRARVRNGAATNADYTAYPAGSQDAFAARGTGRADNGAFGFRFSDSVFVTGQETRLYVAVDSAAPGVRLSLQVRRLQFDPADFRYEMEFGASSGATMVRLTGVNDVYCYFGVWTVDVTRNDSAIARFTRDDASTTVVPAPGRTLSAAESRAIVDLVDAQQLLFDWLQALTLPIQRLLPP